MPTPIPAGVLGTLPPFPDGVIGAGPTWPIGTGGGLGGSGKPDAVAAGTIAPSLLGRGGAVDGDPLVSTLGSGGNS